MLSFLKRLTNLKNLSNFSFSFGFSKKKLNSLLSLFLTITLFSPLSFSSSPNKTNSEILAPPTTVSLDLPSLTPAGAPKKYVYGFWRGLAEGFKSKAMKMLLGGKGMGLAYMTRLKLPVPPGFTITTEAATDYFQDKLSPKRTYPPGLLEEIEVYSVGLEKVRGKKLGDSDDPDLYSVRSGARDSMPGMMETILNIGLNDKSVLGFAKKTNDPRLAWDSYRRLIQMFGKSKTKGEITQIFKISQSL